MCLSKHDHVVDALPPDRADQSFCKTILPRRTGRDRLVANAHSAQAAGDDSTVGPVPIADQVARGIVSGKSLTDLLRDPVCRWMRRHIDPDQFPPSQTNNDQNVKLNKRHGWDHE